MLPDTGYDPAHLPKPSISVAVPFCIAQDLGPPPLGVGLWPRGVMWASVPEASVNEHCESVAREDDVASSPQPWQRVIDTVPMTSPVESLTQGKLTGGVAPLRSTHPRPRFRVRRWRRRPSLPHTRKSKWTCSDACEPSVILVRCARDHVVIEENVARVGSRRSTHKRHGCPIIGRRKNHDAETVEAHTGRIGSPR